MDEPDPIDDHAPSDHTTLTEVLDAFRASGFGGDFFAGERATVLCGTCQAVIAAAQLSIEHLRRLEGASDPADMTAVVATRCPVCAATGTMVLGYGTNASGDETAVWLALVDRRTEQE